MILSEVMKSSRVCNSSSVRRREVALAKSVVAVVLTDLLCWIPIAIIGKLFTENIFDAQRTIAVTGEKLKKTGLSIQEQLAAQLMRKKMQVADQDKEKISKTKDI